MPARVIKRLDEFDEPVKEMDQVGLWMLLGTCSRLAPDAAGTCARSRSCSRTGQRQSTPTRHPLSRHLLSLSHCPGTAVQVSGFILDYVI